MNTEFNLKLVFTALKKNLIWILLITIVFTGVAVALTFTQKPVYSSTATFYSINVASNLSYSSATLVSAQKELVNDYIVITKSDTMLERVAEDIELQNGNSKYRENLSLLRSMISAVQTDETSAFTVTVRSTDKTEAEYIVGAIARNMRPVIDEVNKRENSVATLSEGSVAKKVSPILLNNVIIGFLLGLIGSTAVFILITFYDRTIRTEEDIKKRFKIPVIGVIPEWDSVAKD